jgi:hypothetical protein
MLLATQLESSSYVRPPIFVVVIFLHNVYPTNQLKWLLLPLAKLSLLFIYDINPPQANFHAFYFII